MPIANAKARDTRNEHLLALLRYALGGPLESLLTDGSIDWYAVYEEAKRQSVIGIAYAGVEHLSELDPTPPGQWTAESLQATAPKPKPTANAIKPPMLLLLDWMGEAKQCRKRNQKINRYCAKVTQFFAENGFRNSIMKGQGNALLYNAKARSASPLSDEKNANAKANSPLDPQGRFHSEAEKESLSLLRSPGDIDIWLEGGFKKVNDFIQRIAPTNEVNELEIQMKLDDVDIEVHHRPFIFRNFFYNRRLQRFFQSEAERCFNNTISLPTDDDSQVETIVTTIRFNLIHQLAHIRLHLFTEGIGIRQLIDYYFLLQASTEDKNEIMKIVRYLGMSTFTSALMFIMHDVFHLPEEYLLCPANEKDGLFLLNEILKSGNFGHEDKALKEKKSTRFFRIWLLFFRNLRYWRFDKWDWLAGPLWRIYYSIWRKTHHFK